MEQKEFKLLPPTQEHALRGIKSASRAQQRMIATVDRKIEELQAKKQKMLDVINHFEEPVRALTGGLASWEYFAMKELMKAEYKADNEPEEDFDEEVDAEQEEGAEEEENVFGNPGLPEEAVNEFN